MRNQTFLSIRVAALLALLLCASNAWAITVSPNPSYDGNYTVSWGTTLGCTYNDDPPFYSYYCYSVEGSDSAGSGYSMSISGRPPGSYTYYVYYRFYVYGFLYDEYVAEGPVTVDVLPPPPSFSLSDAATTPEGNAMVFTVTRSGTATGSSSAST